MGDGILLWKLLNTDQSRNKQGTTVFILIDHWVMSRQ